METQMKIQRRAIKRNSWEKESVVGPYATPTERMKTNWTSWTWIKTPRKLGKTLLVGEEKKTV
jgi:hypothetical protein